MPRIDVPFVVEKQHITQPTGEKLVSGGQNYFYATFEMNEVWEDISDIRAVFVRDAISKLVSVTRTETGFECQIPWEVMGYKGAFQVGIFGGDRLLTDYTYVIVKQGCIVEGDEPAPPSPDWFSEMEMRVAGCELPLKTGEAEQSLKHMSAKDVLSPRAVSLGANSTAGGKAYKVIATSEMLENNTGYFTLRTTEGLAVGMECFVKTTIQKNNNVSKIIRIDGNKVYVDNYMVMELDTEEDSPENSSVGNYMLIIGRPDLGDIEVGFNAVTFGEGCMAQDKDTLAGGQGVDIIARYGFGWGRDLKAGYGAAVFGRINQALANQCLAQGQSVVIRPAAHYSDAIGQSLQAGSPMQFIRGRFNKMDGSSKYVVIIGNGTATNKRNNAYMLDWNGNGYFEGDVYVGNTTDISKAKKLVSAEYVDGQIGDIETALDNIITKYGLGGDTV